MARYNRFNHGIKLNHKVDDDGGIFNYRVFGVVGNIVAKLTAGAKPHLLKTSTAIAQISGSFTATARRAMHSVASVVVKAIATAKGIRSRHSTASVPATVLLSAKARLYKRIRGAIDAIALLVLRLRQKYKPLYPRLEHIDYPVIMDCTDYPITMKYIDYPILMEVIGLAMAGSTVTLKGTFPDSAGNLAQLDGVTLKVYAPGRTLVETITPTEIEEGVYTGEFTLPLSPEGQYDYEFSGILGDKTIVGRSTIDSNWR